MRTLPRRNIRYFAIRKQKIRGLHVATPYANRPKLSSKNYLIVTKRQHPIKIEKPGFGLLKKLPRKK